MESSTCDYVNLDALHVHLARFYSFLPLAHTNHTSVGVSAGGEKYTLMLYAHIKKCYTYQVQRSLSRSLVGPWQQR